METLREVCVAGQASLNNDYYSSYRKFTQVFRFIKPSKDTYSLYSKFVLAVNESVA
jgi:hypothetical protein